MRCRGSFREAVWKLDLFSGIELRNRDETDFQASIRVSIPKPLNELLVAIFSKYGVGTAAVAVGNRVAGVAVADIGVVAVDSPVAVAVE